MNKHDEGTVMYVVLWASVAFFITLVFSVPSKADSVTRLSDSITQSVQICAVNSVGPQKCGTGVSIGNGLVLTANHVISDEEMLNSTGAVVGFDRYIPMVLRHNATQYEQAIVVERYPQIDIALLRVKNAPPAVALSETFERDEEVWLVGSPEGYNFDVTITRITGLMLFSRYDGKGPIRMLNINSKDNKVRPGYSGGGVFTSHGLVGILQVCAAGARACGAMPISEIQKERRLKK
jgi:S1-C subfamily serine protease